MKCSDCKFWQKSKMHGSHCKCLKDVKPCELERHNKQSKAREKHKERYKTNSEKYKKEREYRLNQKWQYGDDEYFYYEKD